jgi:hypothetical protein
MMPPPSVLPGLEMAWVLVFNAGEPDEGVYTHTAPGGSPSLLAFVSPEDADAFARQMMAAGFDPATPLCWGAGQVTRFSHATGLEATVVPEGQLPPLPETFDRSTEEEPERMQPWRHDAQRPDPYTAYRMRLEALFPRQPDNCGDDDCTLPASEFAPDDLLRQEAMESIDAILAAHGDDLHAVDLAALMKSAWEKAEEQKRRKPAEEDE